MMSETEEKMSIDNDSDTKMSESKPNLKDLKDVMEFYFSDSNLSKDRFLKQQIESGQDGFIDLAMFLRFNKVRAFECSLKELTESLKDSEMIELNEDNTMIRRKIAYEEPSQKHVDKRTIYVENISSKTTSDKLKRNFEQFGKISYISLPKFKSSDQLKGFAFIEFAEKEDAKKAVEHFKDSINIEEGSIGKFPKANAQIIALEKRIQKLRNEINEFEADKKKNDANESETSSKAEKRAKQKDDSDEEQNKAKSSKTSQSNNEGKKEDKSKSNDPLKNLKVISKKKWLELRENFLIRQKERINELKLTLNEMNKSLQTIKDEKLKKEVPSETLTQTNDIVKGSIIRLTIDLNKENEYKLLKLTRQQFKDAKLNEYNEQIAYVDLEKKSNKIHIRCKSAEQAQLLMADANFLPEFPNKAILNGKDELDYLARIAFGRNKFQAKKEKKSNQDEPTPPPPPAKPITIKVKADTKQPQSKHIKFDDDE